MTSQEFSDLRIPQIRYWRELSILGLMVMELAWIVPWYRSLTPATYAVSMWRVFFVLFGILIMAHLATRATNFLDLKLNIRRGVFIIFIIAAIFIALRLLLPEPGSQSFGDVINQPFRAFNDVRGLIPDEFLVTLVVLLVCWRGIALATKYVDPMSVRGNFYLGLGMYTAFIFVNTIVTGETPGAMLYLFFVAGLIALGSARIYSITQLRGGVSNPFDLRWFLGIFVTTLVIVGLAGFIAWLFSDRTSIMGAISTIALGIFGVLMLIVISPAIFLIERLANVVPNASGAVESMINILENLRNTFGGIADNLLNAFNIPSLQNWIQLLKPVLLWGIVFGVVIIILFTISRWILEERNALQDERESIVESGDLIGLLRSAIRRRLDEFSQSLRSRANLRSGQKWLAAAKIRRIYAQLMDLSSRLGESRPPAYTPLEFLPYLERLLPEGVDDVRLITEAYLRIRYGELPETNQEVKRVEEAWEKVNTLGKEKYSQMPKEERGAISKRN
jgi:uncharacterized membrane protein YeaQ/YmgE (transglycosylase-associated protein family)